MLELARRFPDHEFHVPWFADLLESRFQPGLQTLHGRHVFTIDLEAAEPLVPGGEFLQPGVGGQQDQQAAGVDPAGDVLQEELRIIEAVDEVAGQNQVVTRELILEIVGVPLPELNLVADLFQAEIGQGAFMVGNQLAFFGDGIPDETLFLHVQSGPDETG